MMNKILEVIQLSLELQSFWIKMNCLVDGFTEADMIINACRDMAEHYPISFDLVFDRGSQLAIRQASMGYYNFGHWYWQMLIWLEGLKCQWALGRRV